MCNAFQKIGVETTLAVPENDEHFRGEASDTVNGIIGRKPIFSIIHFHRYTVAGRGTALGSYWGIKSILNRKRDFDYYYTRIPFLARLAIDRGCKIIYEEHHERLHPWRLLNRWYTNRFLKDVCSTNLVKFVVISNALGDIWRKKGVPQEKILIHHDGVAVEDYKIIKTKEEACLTLGIETEKKIVMYVGSLYKDRGIENILKLADLFPEAFFVVVGGPEKQRIIYESKAMQQGLTNIIFMGRVPHYKVKDYLFASDILLMLWDRSVPTINGCSPLKVFEYMAAGRIIVGHGFPTIKEILRDGENALLADPDSYKDLESKLRYAFSLDYPNDMAKRARDLAFSKYSWEKRAEAIVEALQSAR